MHTTSILLILLSAICHALWNFYSKSSKDTRILFFWCGLYTAILAIVVFIINKPMIPTPVWIYILGSAFVHLLYRLFLTQAYTVGEISFVYPITRSAPAFIPIFAYLFLKETISVQGLIGILFVVFSIILYQYREKDYSLKAYFRFLSEPDAIWAYATLTSVIGYSLIDKQGMFILHINTTKIPVMYAVNYYLMENLCSQLLYAGITFLRFHNKQIIHIGKTEWKRALFIVVFSLISYSLILYVLMTEKVSYVTAIRQCSVIFVVLLGGYALKETYTKRRLFAAFIMVIGIFLITMQ